MMRVGLGKTVFTFKLYLLVFLFQFSICLQLIAQIQIRVKETSRVDM